MSTLGRTAQGLRLLLSRPNCAHQSRMRRLQQLAMKSTVMVAAVKGIKALVSRAAAGSRTTIMSTKTVNPTQLKPS